MAGNFQPCSFVYIIRFEEEKLCIHFEGEGMDEKQNHRTSPSVSPSLHHRTKEHRTETDNRLCLRDNEATNPSLNGTQFGAKSVFPPEYPTGTSQQISVAFTLGAIKPNRRNEWRASQKRRRTKTTDEKKS
jgi:hypothetical protein